jgi:hypothetical protein
MQKPKYVPRVDGWFDREIVKFLDSVFNGPYDTGIENLKDAVRKQLQEAYREGKRSVSPTKRPA